MFKDGLLDYHDIIIDEVSEVVRMVTSKSKTSTQKFYINFYSLSQLYYIYLVALTIGNKTENKHFCFPYIDVLLDFFFLHHRQHCSAKNLIR